jgi:hypothetical protein
MLIESCCRCGFLHKDSRYSYRAYKPHYHWTPLSGVRCEGGVTLHATICAACCSDPLNWSEFFQQKDTTPEQYRVKWSLNAPLPVCYLEEANHLYEAQAKAYVF